MSMPHDISLILTLTGGLGAALVLGFVTQKLRLSPLVGYLLAGILVGPHSPGFVADAGLASQLAEIGIILLMFGVGLHFHLKDLLAVRGIALGGAAVQITLTTLSCMFLLQFWGFSLWAGAVFGMSVSVASTVVLTRAMWPWAGWWWRICSPSCCWCSCPLSWAPEKAISGGYWARPCSSWARSRSSPSWPGSA